LEKIKKSKITTRSCWKSNFSYYRKKIKTISGRFINMICDTMCCHGDSPNAVDIVKRVKEEFNKRAIVLKNFL
jgi:UPF0271 protein